MKKACIKYEVFDNIVELPTRDIIKANEGTETVALIMDYLQHISNEPDIYDTYNQAVEAFEALVKASRVGHMSDYKLFSVYEIRAVEYSGDTNGDIENVDTLKTSELPTRAELMGE